MISFPRAFKKELKLDKPNSCQTFGSSELHSFAAYVGIPLQTLVNSSGNENFHFSDRFSVELLLEFISRY